MADDRHRMPPRDAVDPLFDGHHERPFRELTPDERLDWIWEAMQLLAAGRAARRHREGPGEPARADDPRGSS